MRTICLTKLESAAAERGRGMWIARLLLARKPLLRTIIADMTSITLMACISHVSAAQDLTGKIHRPASKSALEQIVVTAQKRSTRLQKTPVSITALTGAELQRRGITSVAALVGTVPGVSIRTGGPGQTEFELRGLSSSGGSSPTVGFYLNDTSLTAPASAQIGKVVIDPSLYDLARIEVLRGPQGTLYGSGSMGGTIRLITNQPDTSKYSATFQSTDSGTAGGGLNHAENAAVNIPLLKDILALRVIGSEGYTSGWIDRIVVSNFPVSVGEKRANLLDLPVSQDHHNVNDSELLGTRVSLLYTPTDRLSITPTVFYQHIDQGGLNAYDSNPGTLAHYEAFDDPEPVIDAFFLASLTANYRFDDFNVTSITSDWDRSETIKQDQAENLQSAFGLPSVYPVDGGLGGGPFSEKDSTRQFSQEVRFASSGNTRFNWVIGAYYSKFTSISALTSIVNGGNALFGTDNQFMSFQPTRISQEAGFGDLSYKIMPKLTATLGLRYYSYDTTVDTTDSGFGTSTGSNASTFSSAKQSSQGGTPKFNLSYQAKDNLLFYATAAEGFRPGGGNQPVPTDSTTELGASCASALRAFGKTSAPLDYQPDNVWSYEIGEKLDLGNRVRINADAYYERWKGVQQTIALSCGYLYTDNAGTAAAYGGELELELLVAHGLVATGSVGYVDAYLTQNVPEAGEQKGAQLQSVAPWTASWALNYTFPLTERLTGFGRIDYSYVGPRVDATYYPINHLPSYSIVNLRAGVRTGNWSATLFLNNATNTLAHLSDEPSLSVNLPTFNRVVTNQPLTSGIDLSYRF